MNDVATLTKKDFESNQDVRWCPGCGDYAVLAQIQKLMPPLGIPRESFAFISGGTSTYCVSWVVISPSDFGGWSLPGNIHSSQDVPGAIS